MPRQSAVTKDNVTIEVSGVIFYKILDAYKASYEIEDSEFNVANLTQTITRAYRVLALLTGIIFVHAYHVFFLTQLEGLFLVHPLLLL